MEKIRRPGKIMKKILESWQCSLLLWHLIILLSFIAANNSIVTMAAPLSATFPIESEDNNVKKFLLNRRIEDERKLGKIQAEIELLLEARARFQNPSSPHAIQPEYSDDGESDEMLPIPSAVVQHGPLREGKRHKYMTLCHFKVCNLGRKRNM